MALTWNNLGGCGCGGGCPVAHYHVGDPTCRAGGTGDESGAQNGPHFHEGSKSCHPEGVYFWQEPPPGACTRPHHHVSDPTWRPAP